MALAQSQTAAAVKRAYGLSARSWWDIGMDLGLSGQVKAPAYAKTAAPGNGKTYQNGQGARDNEAGTFFITIRNNSPLTLRRKGAEILSTAIQGRLKFFSQNVHLAVFSDLKKASRAYPGIVVS